VRRLWCYLTRRLRLKKYCQQPGDSRTRPQIPAKGLLWSMRIGQLLRECSFLAVEAYFIDKILRANQQAPRKQRHTAHRIWERSLRMLGLNWASGDALTGITQLSRRGVLR